MTTTHTPGNQPRRRVRAVLAGAAAGVALAAAGSCTDQQAAPSSTASTSTEPPPVETTAPREAVIHDFVIPEGTAARLGSAAAPEFIPQPLEVWVGDSIRVRNDDSELFRLGIFDVHPGETVSMAFNTPGEMEGVIYSDQGGGCGAPPPDVPTFVINVLTDATDGSTRTE